MIANFLRNHTTSTLKRDLISGLTLFVMLIPQGMAYAMLAGLPPVMGLYASTIPVFVYAMLGSSRHLSVGPVAITSLLVFSGVSVYAEPNSSSYISTVIVLAFMVGAIQVLFGLLRLGFIVKFIPHSVMNGYTSAAAIVIGVSQLKHLLGIELGNYLQVHLLLLEVFQKFNDINSLTILIGGGCIVLLLAMKKWTPKLPAALVAVVLSIVTVVFFRLETQNLRVVGDIPNGFPGFAFPHISFELIKMLAPLALTIAMLGIMESLSIAKTVAKKEKYEIKPNKEFTALGFSNIVGSCFSSFPVNGSFSRTAVNHQAGGATQLTAIITGLLVMITVTFFTSFFYYLPNATLAAIIMVAVYKLIDIKEMKHLFKVKPFEGWIWVATFLTTLFVGIQWGIIFGALFTLVLIIKKSAEPNIAQLGYVVKEKSFRDISRYPEAITANEVVLLRIDSSLHFANISFLEEKIKQLLNNNTIQWLIIEMSGVNDIDTISTQRLGELIDSYQRKGVTVLFAHMKGSVRDTVNRVGWQEKYQGQQYHLTIDQLLREKGLRSYFDPSYQYVSAGKDVWNNDYII
ncbi:SulP family inorganic anion transporter [Alkalihalobacillus sp. BA299]|uniref:SulP family inorganic anion transporter n=1 Tax=Alkalihalobacillus sp. BA299 TaxID=2815938 RepID=UPI001ADD2E3F|nr:solute carrier family 26 protein [Alkalihalobacillus sp. BA299]